MLRLLFVLGLTSGYTGSGIAADTFSQRCIGSRCAVYSTQEGRVGSYEDLRMGRVRVRDATGRVLATVERRSLDRFRVTRARR